MSHFTKEQRNKSILDDFVYEERSTWLFSSIDSDHFSILLTFNLHIYKYMQGWVQEYSVDTCRKQNIQYIVVIHPQYRTGVFLKRPEHTKFSVILKVWLQSKFFQNFYHICESCTVKVATFSGHIAGQQLMAHGSRAHYSEQDLRSYWEPNSLNSGWHRQNPRVTTPTDRPQNKHFMAWQQL